MKVETKEANQVKEREFPKLMSGMGGIVLFVDETCGTYLVGNKYPIGNYRDNWPSGMFENFEGSITLSND